MSMPPTHDTTRRTRPVTLRVRRFKSLEAALRPLKRFLNDPALLRIGRPMEHFGRMLPREVLGNWLVCAASNCVRPEAPLHFATDPDGGDGLIYDEKNKIAYHTEHVFVAPAAAGETRSIEELIRDAVTHKKALGRPYATGKQLVVLLDAYQSRVEWQPAKAAEMLPPHDFASVWVAGRSEVSDEYVTFAVSRLTPVEHGQPLGVLVRIHRHSDRWEAQALTAPIAAGSS